MHLTSFSRRAFFAPTQDTSGRSTWSEPCAMFSPKNQVFPSRNVSTPFPLSVSPFFSNPITTNRNHTLKAKRLTKKWGGTAGWNEQKLRHNLKGRGLQAGIPHFNLDRLAANSMASHRLIQMLGKRYGLAVSEAIYDTLNVYFFVDGHSLNDQPRLAAVVAARLKELDIDEDRLVSEAELLAFLQGSEGREEIETARAALEQMGVHGIPKFIIGGYTIVDGAAQSNEFIDIFRSIERNPGVVKPTTVFGAMLGVSPDIVERGSHTKESLEAAA